MKKIFVIIICLLNVVNIITAQTTVKIPELDKSPMDMSYFPDQYPMQKFQGKVTTPPTCRVIYGRPQKDGRTIFGDLIKYNEVWRIGANECTELELYKNVTIGGKAVAKGKYSLYCIPTEKEWTFIINKDTDNWGAFKYDVKKDIVRVKVKPTALDTSVEALSIFFSKTTNGATLNVSWDKTIAYLPIVF
jgi:hypothetical protein